MSAAHQGRSRIARILQILAVPIVLAWVAIMMVTNASVPTLEKVGHDNAVSLSPQDSPALIAIKRLGHTFGQFTSDNMAMIVLEGDQRLGPDARTYYDSLMQALEADTAHVEHVQNFWGDLITAAGSQSTDGKAAYVQVHLAGDTGSTQGDESVAAVRDIVNRSHPPAGVRAYVTGQGPLTTDMNRAGDESLTMITMITFGVIAVLLLIVYRSVWTMLLMMVMVFVTMSSARGVVAVLGHAQLFGLTTFSISLLTSLSIATSTDYAIFLVGRYHEARQAGEDREQAYHTAFRSVGHVVLGSGLTVAGAVFCLHFTRLPYFSSMGLPSAIALTVVVMASLTLAPAVLVIGTRFGRFDPRKKLQTRDWRRVGTAVVRWPVPILAASIAVALVGLLALPGYQTNYNDRHYIPASEPSVVGYTAADRHFSAARLNPDILLVEAGRDMRNAADMILLDRIAKNVMRVHGVARVQSITRPLGEPIANGSIPFQVSMQSVATTENLQFLKARMDDMLGMTDQLGEMIRTMERQHQLMSQMTGITDDLVGNMADMKATSEQMRDNMANFDDFLRPVRNYFYWEPHCFNIPICSAFRSFFDGLDGIDNLTENFDAALKNMTALNGLMPQLVALMPTTIAIAKSMQSTMTTLHTTFTGLIGQMERMTDTATAMGQAFDQSKSDDYFYLPPEAFDSPDFQRGLKLMLSPDGTAAQFIITHEVDPATPEGISTVDAELQAARDAVKATPLADAKLSLGGTAAMFKDIEVGAQWDLLISALAAMTLIFLVMLILIRALIAALVIVGTVVVSLATAFGLSVIIWQYLIGINLHWIVMAFSVIILLAVGSDYNLLVVSRMKEEIGAGINTGIIRAMGATGKVVTAAGLVFAITMATLGISDLTQTAQGGTTIAIGLLFDTMIVRSLMTPSIAAILGRWFWWPLKVRNKPLRTPAPSEVALARAEERP
ncbi:MMPL family transporter [Mycobacteroides abscessus subsp. abscessus]|uniref:MMPL/RND family transporter n=1 Tax=Mycobacteroides abscessus TaxID=36809 RepID=UPI00266C78DA|nr:MMPL family transporter [Mycobacteroides abscessus]MDO3012724.1 MMPL family transporter [Mycobacteroides abscessus subsp. abscessus]